MYKFYLLPLTKFPLLGSLHQPKHFREQTGKADGTEPSRLHTEIVTLNKKWRQWMLQVLTSLNKFKPSFENEMQIEYTDKVQSFLYFRIADNGIGISRESITHLFEHYHRVSDAHIGSGIGLAFVKSLTQLHKRNIFVSSERN